MSHSGYTTLGGFSHFFIKYGEWTSSISQNQAIVQNCTLSYLCTEEKC